MPRDEEAIRCLEMCFSGSDWTVLKNNPEFQEVLSKVQTLDDIQAASIFGDEILLRLRPKKKVEASSRVDDRDACNRNRAWAFLARIRHALQRVIAPGLAGFGRRLSQLRAPFFIARTAKSFRMKWKSKRGQVCPRSGLRGPPNSGEDGQSR
jgi:hypothetical protein